MKKNNVKKLFAAAMAALIFAGSIPVNAIELSDGSDSSIEEYSSSELIEDSEDLLLNGGDEVLTDEESSTSMTEELSSGEEDELSSGDETDSASGLRYIKGRPLTAEEEAEQLEPMYGLTDLSSFTIGSDLYDDEAQLVMMGEPTQYDAREEGLITSVKNQGSYNNCWAYTLASLMETSLLSKGYGTYDLSEEQLSYFFANRVADPLGNTANDTVVKIDGNFRNGGNPLLGAMHLSTWSGMALDSVYPTGSSTFTTDSAYDTAAYLQNAVFSDYSEARMKTLLLQYGSVGALVYFRSTSSYYNADTAALYNPSALGVNHAVTVVGWDDTYEKENFKNSDSLTSDGAWIVKNSWGSSWGDEGYFYLSYEDQTISNLVAVTAEVSETYANNYFYDGTSGIATTNLDNGNQMAAAFEAKASETDGTADPAYDEIIGEIVLAPASDNTSFEVQIYTELQDFDDPESGTPAYSTPMTITQEYAGIHTYSITPVRVESGSRYSIVVTNVTGETIRVYSGYTNSYSSSNPWITFTESSEMQQTFINRGSGWTDRGNVAKSPTFRIKAHTQVVENSYDLAFYGEQEEILSDIEQSIDLEVNSTRDVSASLIKNGELRTDKTSALGYESSNTEVLTVSENGVIIPAATGAADITISTSLVPDRTLTIHVRVYQEASDLSATALGAGRIKLTWNQGSNIDGYILYRKEADEDYIVRRSFSTEDVSTYTDMKMASSNVYIKPGVTYTYKLASYILENGERKILSVSSEVSAVTNLAKITTTARAYSNSSKAYNSITWNKDAYADGYFLYRKEGSGSYSRIAQITDVSTLRYTDEDIEYLGTYTYAVRAYKDADGKRYLGTYTASQKIIAAPANTRVVLTVAGKSGVLLRWNRQAGVTGYIVYRKEGSGSYKKIATVTGATTGSYTDSSAPKNTTLQYAVRAYVTEPYGIMQGTYTAGSTVKRTS